jgi:hypothetical protein
LGLIYASLLNEANQVQSLFTAAPMKSSKNLTANEQPATATLSTTKSEKILKSSDTTNPSSISKKNVNSNQDSLSGKNKKTLAKVSEMF